MSDFFVERYSNESVNEWNHFALSAKNSHFMFKRDYMDYHSDRFEDNSLIIRNSKGSICALLPANSNNGGLYSHEGLTFGGLLLPLNISLERVLLIFKKICEYLKEFGFSKLVYKAVPYIYSKLPSQDDLYALHFLGAKNIRRDASSAIDLSMPVRYSKGRKWSVKKAHDQEIDIIKSDQFELFWPLLNDVLKNQHDTRPVHTIDEIQSLSDKFPNNIKLHMALYKGEIVAGAVVYETDVVAHTQYLANSDQGRDISALDLLLDDLIKVEYNSKRFFDFGISTIEAGKKLNSGLASQKEGFGARTIVHDFYELTIL